MQDDVEESKEEEKAPMKKVRTRDDGAEETSQPQMQICAWKVQRPWTQNSVGKCRSHG